MLKILIGIMTVQNGIKRRTNNVLHNRLFLNNIYDSSSNNIIRKDREYAT